jgi:DNA-directed RNA polymerase specialized sigma24 family protein
MSNWLYDFETGKYVNVNDLNKDGTAFIKKERTEVVNNNYLVENTADKKRISKDFWATDLLRKEFLKTLSIDEIGLCLLSEYGYNQEEIAEIIKVCQKTVSNRLTYLENKFIKFLE